MHATVKEIAAKLGKDETEVRSVKALFNLKERGDAPKADKQRGAAAKLYKLEDVERAFQVVASFQQD